MSGVASDNYYSNASGWKASTSRANDGWDENWGDDEQWDENWAAYDYATGRKKQEKDWDKWEGDGWEDDDDWDPENYDGAGEVYYG